MLLQSLVTLKDMNHYTHVILDEVHEREVDMDLLLIVVRRLLSTNSKNVKVILMSATIDANEFSEYFKIPKKTGCLPAPVLNIQNKTLFEVNEFYFDDLYKLRTVSVTFNFYFYVTITFNYSFFFDQFENDILIDQQFYTMYLQYIKCKIF